MSRGAILIINKKKNSAMMDALLAVIITLRKVIKDKAVNDRLLGMLDLVLVGTRDTLEACARSTSRPQHASLQEVENILNALQEKAHYYCTQCSWTWTAAFASSFNDEFEILLRDLHAATSRMTAATTGEVLAKLTEMKRDIQGLSAEIAGQFLRLQGTEDVEEASEMIEVLAKHLHKSAEEILTELRMSKAELKVRSFLRPPNPLHAVLCAGGHQGPRPRVRNHLCRD